MAAEATPRMNLDSADGFIDSLWQGRLVEPRLLKEWAVESGELTGTNSEVAADLVRRGVLTAYQADECLAGRGSQLTVGPYHLVEPLARVNCCPLFRARHNETSRVVAIKLFPPEQIPRADTTEAHRFHRQAEAMARLRHPNLVSVLGDGTSGGVRYLAMELAEGMDLPRFLDRQAPLDPLQACRYAEQAAHALQYAYEQRLVPCELNASDLIVTDQGASVKLLITGRGQLGRSARGLGEFEFGSLLDPNAAGRDEVAAELAAEALREDVQAALAGLGRLLQLMLSDRGVRVHGEAEQLSGDPATPLPKDLAAIIANMVADNPTQRYATPRDCAAALARFCALQASSAAEAAVTPPFKPWSAGDPPLVHFTAVFAVMILLGVFAGSSIAWHSSKAPAGSTVRVPLSPKPVAIASVSSQPSPRPTKRLAKKRPPEDPRYRALVQAGTAELNQNAIAKALVQFGEAVRLRPDLATAYMRRAEAATRWEAFRDVVADCNQAILLEPSAAVAYRLRGAALAALGDDGGAIADSTKAIDLDARDAHAFNTRGVARFNRGEFRAAVEDFGTAVRIDETLAGASGNLAWLLATVPDTGIRNGYLAVKHAKRACELTDWEDPVQLKNLAAAHAECHDFDAAIRFQKQALDQCRRLPGTGGDQYRALLNLYLAGQPALNAAKSLHIPKPANFPNEASQVPVPSTTEMQHGVRPSLRRLPTFRGKPRTEPSPFVPLYRSGSLSRPRKADHPHCLGA